MTARLPSDWRRADLGVTLAGLLLVLLWDAAGLDRTAMHLVGGSAGFGWQHHPFTRGVLHDGGRWLGWAVALALLVNVRWPWLPGPDRNERLRWLLVTLTCVAVVPAIKQISRTSCPWDLAEFGGVAQYVSHWQLGLGDGGPGRCFPSGHATAAFAFFGGWFVLRPYSLRAAGLWLATVVLAGVVFGGGQYLRGAHYPSHTLWTAWLCWVLSWLALARPWQPAAIVRSGQAFTAGSQDRRRGIGLE